MPKRRAMKYRVTFHRLTLEGISLGSSTITRTWKDDAAIRRGIGLLNSQYRKQGELLIGIKYSPLPIKVSSVKKVEEIPVYTGIPIIGGLKLMGNHLQCPTCGVVVGKDGCQSC
jgi:hypothetical protein